MIQTIDLETIRSLVTNENAYDAVRDGLTKLAAGEVTAPDELALLRKPVGDVHVKGAHIAGADWIVFKVASGSFPGAANSGCSFLLDATTGYPMFVLDDGGWLTEMRTAAAGAIAADALAISGPLRVAVLGTGTQARFQLAALQARRQLTSINVWGRTQESADQLAEEVSGQAHMSVAEAVAGADVIVTTTSATSPILTAADIAPGVHITAMGSDTVGKREIASDVMDIVDVIAADDLATCSRVGELQHTPKHQNRAIALAALVAGKAPGRQSPEQITIADLCGIGTHDAAIAGLVANLLLTDDGQKPGDAR